MFKFKFFIFLLCVSSILIGVTDRLLSKNKPKPETKPALQSELFGKPFLDFKTYKLSPNMPKFQNDKSGLDPKSHKKAMLFSLLVPGSGEFYSKAWIKGLVFLGIEVGAWTAYSSYHSKGKDIEKEYIQFAEDNWDKDKWLYWFNTKADQERYAHHDLPDTKTQQYYEMIGKYQKFNAGWRDMWVDDETFEFYNVDTDTSDLSLSYMDLRGQSNEKLKLATTATIVALANHVFSAFDAIWSVNRYNKKVKSSLDVAYIMINNQPIPVAKLTLTW